MIQLLCPQPFCLSQVGLVLHYSSLSTMLWLGVTARNIYKQVTKRPPQSRDGDPPPSPKQTLLSIGATSAPILRSSDPPIPPHPCPSPRGQTNILIVIEFSGGGERGENVEEGETAAGGWEGRMRTEEGGLGCCDRGRDWEEIAWRDAGLRVDDCAEEPGQGQFREGAKRFVSALNFEGSTSCHESAIGH
ncbi:unnamed protein product [Menidia menidia]|uniref:(Atlantic silverside) hypothetical protein n=1 Tax=Menidia menidia TaxID=238744 RepID=A0A8S4BYL8_9TELE|nr:unnamed protein product [Menidia menidia]